MPGNANTPLFSCTPGSIERARAALQSFEDEVSIALASAAFDALTAIAEQLASHERSINALIHNAATAAEIATAAGNTNTNDVE